MTASTQAQRAAIAKDMVGQMQAHEAALVARLRTIHPAETAYATSREGGSLVLRRVPAGLLLAGADFAQPLDAASISLKGVNDFNAAKVQAGVPSVQVFLRPLAEVLVEAIQTNGECIAKLQRIAAGAE